MNKNNTIIKRFPLLDFFLDLGDAFATGDGVVITGGSGSSGSGVTGMSSSTSIISSTGWMLSRSSSPGASGIGPKTRPHIESIDDAVIGFSTHPIAPAE